jgi:uncharacterized SAM-binding protein YcdF (DUF218 family)
VPKLFCAWDCYQNLLKCPPPPTQRPDNERHLGLSEDRLIVEGRSRTTAENAVFSRAIAPDLEGPWILVTSAFHMPRALRTFCAAGWHNLVPYPTDYRGGKIWDQMGWKIAENLTDLNIA